MANKMKLYEYRIPVFHKDQLPIDCENEPEPWTILEGEAEFESYEDAWNEMVLGCPYAMVSIDAEINLK